MKRFLTTILWLCATYVGFAQTAIGVKVNTPLHSFNFFNELTSNENYDIEIYPRIAAFNSGVFAHFQLAKRWALQTEVLYRRETLSFRPKNSTWDYEERPYYEFDYLEIPLMMQFEGKKPVRGFTQLGFSPKISTRAAFRDKGSNEVQDMKYYFGTGQLHINFNIGGGLLIERSRWLLFAEARYSVNLTKMATNSGSPYLNFREARNHTLTFSLGAGYKFSKKKNDTPPTEEIVAPTEEVIAPTEEIVTPTEEVNKEPITE